MSADGTKAGMLWTGLEKVLVYGVNFAQGVVLARLLTPDDFGLTAMLGIFLALGGLFAESGLGTALVVRKSGWNWEIGRRVLKWNVGIAIVAYVFLAAAARGIAVWYGKPILAPLMLVMALGMVINAASVVATAQLTRAMAFGRLAWVNSGSSIIGATVAIGLAYGNCGVWSIACMGIVQACVRTSLAWCLVRMPLASAGAEDPRQEGEFKKLLGYGWKLTASGVIHTFYMESYNLIIGKMWSSAAVGLFARGNRWARLPAEVVNDSVGRVALPALVNGRSSLALFCINAGLLWPALVLAYAFASELVGGILGQKWLDCVPYLRILLVGQSFTPIGNIALHQLRASGQAELILKTDMWKKPIGFAALLSVIPFGVAGLCWAKVVSDLAEACADVWYALRCRRAEEPIDLVYCWYGGKIPEGVDACRASDNGELRYSIRSVDCFAPWIRRIHVLVNDDAVVPAWLSGHAKVRIVRLSEFIPRDVLPLNNSASIEMWLHRVPGLSERFVYSNDDMFLGASVAPDDFFDSRGRMICRYSGYSTVFKTPENAYEGMLLYSRRFLNDRYGRMPHHNMDGYLKSVIADFWKTYPEEARRSGSFRHRVSDQLQRDAFSCHAVKLGRGVRRISDRCARLSRLVDLGIYTSQYFSLADRNIPAFLKKYRPKFFCLNDTEDSTDAQRAEVRMVLDDIFASVN